MIENKLVKLNTIKMDSDSDSQIEMSWEDFGINSDLCDALRGAGYAHPTEVQMHSMKNVVSRSDMMIAARTGEGKTLCFLIPILNNIITQYETTLSKSGLDHDSDPKILAPIQKSVFNEVKALIMSPTRELAVQIKEHLKRIIPAKYSKLLYSCELIGGMSQAKQERVLSYGPCIIIGTPGRIWDLIDTGNNQYLEKSMPKHLEVLVLDEADRMVEVGHFKEMNQILGRLTTLINAIM